MTNERDHMNEKPSESLIDALRAEFGGPMAPGEHDWQTLARMHRHQAHQQRVRWAIRGAALGGVAATLALGVWLQGVIRTSYRSTAEFEHVALVGDADESGQVDILDAYLVARSVRDAQALPPTWDTNDDGAVDQADIDWIAARAVQLRSEGSS